MMPRITHTVLSILLLLPLTATADLPVLQHDLVIKFDVADRAFTARDRIVMHRSGDAEARALPDFTINPSWHLSSLSINGEPVTARTHNGRIAVPAGTNRLDIAYGGRLEQSQWPYIVWLAGDGWYPEAADHLVRFTLTLEAPPGWRALTQGVAVESSSDVELIWVQNDPQQGIYLVAGPWHVRSKHNAGYGAGVMLIHRDDELERLYLEATRKHLHLYSAAIGPYPYDSFTLVENVRQTGWGMPAFTLLGSRVIRLPFIINTSFPHEILHNWWGNGVFVDDVKGNWSEGLTTYLSDHLMRERQGDGRQYRLDSLISWHDFAAQGADFPLSRFTGRHDRATQAVGYGKGMFLFHMLRRELGDAVFLAGLRHLYAEFLFKRTSFGDVQRAFEQVCRCSLDVFFAQWLDRPSAPVLRLDSAQQETKAGGHGLTITVGQSGVEPWALNVPVRVIDNRGNATMQSVRLNERSALFYFELDAPAARVDLDPEIDLFRMLDEGEKPTTFSKVFAAQEAAVIAADDTFKETATAIAEQNPGWQEIDGSAQAPPAAEVIVVLGEQHHVLPWLASPSRARYGFDDDEVTVAGATYPLDPESVVVLVDTVRIGKATKTVLGVVSRHSAGLTGLVRRLSHYGRFSYAVFDQAENRATAAGQWRGEAISLSRIFDDSIAVPGARQPAPLF